jgi:peptide/nickel transport system substrate-binding protein
MIARAVTVLLLAATLAGCGGGPPRDRNVIVVAVRTPVNNLDPRQANDETSQRVGQLVFSCLLDVGDDLRVVPRLALRLDNPDPLTYVAHLRRGVRFHDGSQLTSADVVYTYAAFLDPAYISPFKGAFRVLQSVRAIDDYTVEFKLHEPFAAFPAQLAGVPPIVPAGSGNSMRTFPIGTGPYRFVSAHEDVVTLAAFEGYFDGLPNNAGIVLKVVPDDTMRGLELRKGSVDVVVNDLPPDMVHQLETKGAFAVTRDPGLDFSYLGFNMRDPLLQDKRVRHAIGYAINRDAIITYLRRGLARPAFGLVPPQAWAFEPNVRTFSYDPAKAKALLDEAGYRDPDGDGPQPRLRLSLKISTNEETRLQSTVMQQDLRRVGIDLDLRSYEFATFYADVLKGDFQIFSLQWVGGALADPDIIRRVFHSNQVPPSGFNRGYYQNAEVDRLIDEASRARSEEERRGKYSRAQQLIAEDAPYIPIWNRVNVILAQPGFTGLHLPPTGDFQALRDVRWSGLGPPSDAPGTPRTPN